MDRDELELQKKLKQNLSKDFDKNFWKRYNNEINEEESSLGIWIPLSGFAATCVLVLVIMNTTNIHKITEQDMVAISIDKEMYENMDLLANIDDDMMNLSDKDWNELLEPI